MNAEGPRPRQPLLAAVLTPLSQLVDLWRRSIQARVVIGTLLLSTVLMVLAGWVMLRQVADGVLDSKRQAALTQAAAGIDTAQSELFNGLFQLFSSHFRMLQGNGR